MSRRSRYRGKRRFEGGRGLERDRLFGLSLRASPISRLNRRRTRGGPPRSRLIPCRPPWEGRQITGLSVVVSSALGPHSGTEAVAGGPGRPLAQPRLRRGGNRHLAKSSYWQRCLLLFGGRVRKALLRSNGSRSVVKNRLPLGGNCYRPQRRSGCASQLERHGDEQEFIHLVPGQVFQPQHFDD